MYDFEDEYDYEFESFAEESGFLTNVNAQDLPQYQKAIEQYRLVNPTCTLVISNGYGYPHALYCRSDINDLSAFWRIFDGCK